MSDWLGKTLGHYQITELIGQGGMATVYLARQTTVQRDVAVKIINRFAEQEADFVARFDREVGIIASLEHIHILPIYDYGHAEGYSYLVMRYLTGGSLNKRLKQAPIDLSYVERLIAQIASALDYAHEHGVVHRDLKPHNILLDMQGNAFLADFGIARLVKDTHSLTQTGTAVGTPSYMSPEQWQGDPTDPRTDVYALGVMLFELLTGQLPFEAESLVSLMYKHLHNMPPMPSKIREGLSSILDNIVLRALAKDPDDRFPSAGALARSVSEALQQPTQAAPMIWVERRPVTDDLEMDSAPTDVLNLQASPFVGRAWVLDAFERWQRSEHSQVFFLTGPNGIGKSEMAHRFAESLGHHVIGYELVATQARSLDPRFFVNTVATQLATLLHDRGTQPLDVLENAFADPLEAFENRILQPLRDEIEPVYLLIDGLELAFDYPGATIVDVLEATLDDLPEALRLIVTAAPDVQLDRLFANAERLELQAHSEEDQADVLATLSTRLQTMLPSLGRNQEDLLALQQKSQGNPLYLNTVFEHLVYKRIELADLADLPTGLDDLYAYLIERAEQVDPEIRGVLRVLAIIRAPVSSTLLAEILGKGRDEVHHWLSGLQPLVRHSDAGWELAHPALRYWLASSDNIGVMEAHRRIAETLSHNLPAQMDLYALQNLTAHFIAAQQPAQAFDLLTDLNFLEAKLTQCGLNELVADFNFVRPAVPAVAAQVLDDILNALQELASPLIETPNHAFAQLYNRLSGHELLTEKLALSVSKRRGPWLRQVWPIKQDDSPQTQVLWQGMPIQALSATPQTGSVVYQPRWLAACDDGTLRLWEEGQLLHEWPAYTGLARSLSACALNADGSLALSGLNDGSVTVWDVETTRMIHTLRHHEGEITGCVFSPDSRLILSTSADRLLMLSDAKTGKLIQSFHKHPDTVRCCAFTLDGQMALSGADDGIVRVWNVEKGAFLGELKGHRSRISACATSTLPDRGPIAVTGSTSGEILMWELRRGTLIQTLSGHASGIRALTFGEYEGSPVLLSAGEDRMVHLWNVESGQMLATLESFSQAATGCTLYANRYIVASSLDGTLQRYELRQQPQIIQRHSAEVHGCVFTPESRRVLTASLDRDLRLWDATSGQLLKLLKGHTGGVNRCAVRSDGLVGLSASSDRTLRVWDLNQGTLRAPLYGHADAVWACAISPQPVALPSQSARWLAASGGADRLIKIWDLDSAQAILSLKGHGNTITDIAFHPKGDQVLSVSKDRTARLWSLADGTNKVLLTDDSPLTACAFHPDGQRLVFGAEDGRLIVVNMEMEYIATLGTASNGAISSCGFSANGQLIYATATDGSIRLWSSRDSQLLISLCSTDGALTGGALAPDNLTFVSGAANGAVSLFRIEGLTGTRRKTNT